MPNRANTDETALPAGLSGKVDVTTIASGALLAVPLYMLGMLGHKLDWSACTGRHVVHGGAGETV